MKKPDTETYRLCRQLQVGGRKDKEPDRKYMNERWCVRCHKQDATPFLREVFDKVNKWNAEVCAKTCVDIGCGNGRNTEWMRSRGYEVIPLDHAAGCEGYRDVVLGESPMPVFSKTVGVILANYVLMFLKPKQQMQVLKEIDRIAAPGAWLVIEYYPAKDSWAPTQEDAVKMQDRHLDWLEKKGWQVAKDLKNRALLRKPWKHEGGWEPVYNCRRKKV